MKKDMSDGEILLELNITPSMISRALHDFFESSTLFDEDDDEDDIVLAKALFPKAGFSKNNKKIICDKLEELIGIYTEVPKNSYDNLISFEANPNLVHVSQTVLSIYNLINTSVKKQLKPNYQDILDRLSLDEKVKDVIVNSRVTDLWINIELRNNNYFDSIKELKKIFIEKKYKSKFMHDIASSALIVSLKRSSKHL